MSFFLVQELKDVLEKHFADTAFRDPGKDEVFIAPRFFINSLPPKRKHGKDNEDFPFVLVRATEGRDEQEYAEISTQIFCGIYTAEGITAGGNEIQNMVDRIRTYLLTNRMLAKKFELQFPLTWSLGTDEERNQPHPYYIGTITATWHAVHAAVLQSIAQEIEAYGSGLQ
jgi:hypothetical protein